MSKPRKTYYRVVDGKIEKVRRVIPPEGWTTDRKKLELELKARQTPLITITAKTKELSDLMQEGSSSFEEELKEQLAAEQKKVRALQAEVATLKRRTETDDTIRKRIEEERREKRFQELDRTAMFAKRNSGIQEEEYYRVKTLSQGLKQRLEAMEERHEQLQQTYSKEQSKRSTAQSQLERFDQLIALLYAALRKFYRTTDNVVSKLPPAEQGDYRRRFDRVFHRCENKLYQAGWSIKDHELPTF